MSTAGVLKTSESVVKTLNDLTGETVNVIIRDRENVFVVMKEESRHAVRYFHNIGSSQPAYASSVGKALLSELTDEEIDSLFPEERPRPLTEKTIVSKTELKLELEHNKETVGGMRARL